MFNSRFIAKSKSILLLIFPIMILLLAGCQNDTADKNTEGGETGIQTYQEFFMRNPDGVMGTVDNGVARTRTFQVLWVEDNKLYFCTGNHKPVYEQMKENPNVSFTALNPETLESVTISGVAVFVDDLDGKKRALEENPGIKAIYKSPDNPVFELLYVEATEVSSYIFSK